MTVIANGIPSLSLVQGGAVKVYYPLRYAFNSTTQLFSGNLTLVNLSAFTISGTITIVFPTLPSGITLANATGTIGGQPDITVSGTLLPFGSLHVFYELRDPLNAPLTSFFFGFPVQIFVRLYG